MICPGGRSPNPGWFAPPADFEESASFWVSSAFSQANAAAVVVRPAETESSGSVLDRLPAKWKASAVSKITPSRMPITGLNDFFPEDFEEARELSERPAGPLPAFLSYVRFTLPDFKAPSSRVFAFVLPSAPDLLMQAISRNKTKIPQNPMPNASSNASAPSARWANANNAHPRGISVRSAAILAMQLAAASTERTHTAIPTTEAIAAQKAAVSLNSPT